MTGLGINKFPSDFQTALRIPFDWGQHNAGRNVHPEDWGPFDSARKPEITQSMTFADAQCLPTAATRRGGSYINSWIGRESLTRCEGRPDELYTILSGLIPSYRYTLETRFSGA